MSKHEGLLLFEGGDEGRVGGLEAVASVIRNMLKELLGYRRVWRSMLVAAYVWEAGLSAVVDGTLAVVGMNGCGSRWTVRDTSVDGKEVFGLEKERGHMMDPTDIERGDRTGCVEHWGVGMKRR